MSDVKGALMLRIPWQELSHVACELRDWEIHAGLGARNQGRGPALSVTDQAYRSPASKAGSSLGDLSLPFSRRW